MRPLWRTFYSERRMPRESREISPGLDIVMKSKRLYTVEFLATLALLSFLCACKSVPADAAAQAPPDAKVVPMADAALFSVDHPEQFPLAEAAAHSAVSELVVTGTVTPDVSRNVPVASLASGRVNAIHARLG